MAETGTSPGSRSAARRFRWLSGRVLALVGVAALFALAAALVVPGAASKDAPAVDKGIWLTQGEILALPRKGAAWRRLKAVADGDLGHANISDQNSKHDVRTLAVALAYVRTGRESYRSKAAGAIMSAIGTEHGGRTLALGRNLVAYVIAADLINLRAYDSGRNALFTAWLRSVRSEQLSGFTLIAANEIRPNNWGTHAGASRAAIDVYIGDTQDLARVASVLQGWLGDRSAYAGFDYGSLDWQADPDGPIGVNPAGASKEGFSIDGALPEEMRRGGRFRVPPKHTEYPWEGLAGAIVQAQILSRQGYDAWGWSDQALRRAFQFLADVDREYGDWWAGDDDTWQPWLVNAAYGTEFATDPVTELGKNMAFTDWTHR